MLPRFLRYGESFYAIPGRQWRRRQWREGRMLLRYVAHDRGRA